MKKKDLFYYIAVSIVILAIGIVTYFKFIAAKPQVPVEVDHMNNLMITDMSGNLKNFDSILHQNGTAYCLLFFQNDCYSCIYKGVQDLIQLKKNGQDCFGLVVHELQNEVEGWAGTQDFSPFYRIDKAEFYKSIKTPVTPVMLKFENRSLTGFHFVKP